MGRRVLVFSSIGHALMHMMTAFYAVIVLTLAIAWDLPVESLLELYAPSAILLGIMSLPAGWASDRFGAPVMMVVMFVGLGLSSIACGLVADGRHVHARAGALRARRLRRHLPLGRHRLDHPHRPRARSRHGRERPVGQRRAGALRHRAGRADHPRLVARGLHRAGRRLPRGRRCARLEIKHGRIGDRPMPATTGVQPGRARVLARLLRALRHHGARRHHLAGGDVRRGDGVRDAAGRRYRAAARRACRRGAWPPRPCCGSGSRPR